MVLVAALALSKDGVRAEDRRNVLAQDHTETLVTEVRQAIANAVQSRLRVQVDVSIVDLQIRGDFAGLTGIVATVDPDSRLGTPMRVALRAYRGRTKAQRVGEAQAVVRVRGVAHYVQSPLERGEVITESHIREERTWLDDLPVRPLPTSVVGARAARALLPGTMVMAQDVVKDPEVKNGGQVRLILLDGALEATLEGIAAQDGERGETVRVVNAQSGRVLRGRVIGPNTVEVIHGS